jgi:hypothetical protein
MKLCYVPKDTVELVRYLDGLKSKGSIPEEKHETLLEAAKQTGLLVTIESQDDDHVSMDRDDCPDDDDECEDQWDMEGECYDVAVGQADEAWDDTEVAVTWAEDPVDEEYVVLHLNLGDDGPDIHEMGRGGVAAYGWDFHRLEHYCVIPISILQILDVMAA